MKKEYKMQDKVVKNIINALDSILQEQEDKINAYVEYLSKLTDLKPNRIRTILNVNRKRRITIEELYKISTALQMSLSELFTFNENVERR